MKENWLKRKLSEGRAVLGPFCKCGEGAIYELAGLAGFDFAIIDMEHGPLSYETAQNLVRACEAAEISPVIRVPQNEAQYISRALDLGAHGVQVPEINSGEEAARLAAAARYHPLGARGVCRFVRAAEYSRVSKERYFAQANAQVLVIAHLEGERGLKNLAEILQVPGLDVIFIGPYDLSQSLGLTGQIQHPAVIERMQAVVAQARAAGKAVGTFVETPAEARTWMERGVSYLGYSVDVAMVLEKFTDVVRSVAAADEAGRK